MRKYKVTVLSPIHIGNGNEYSIGYNLISKDKYVYIYDEFKLGEFFLKNNLGMPTSESEMSAKLNAYADKIIATNTHIRAIENDFNINKALLACISSQQSPIIPGSSIKGSIRTAMLEQMVQDDKIGKGRFVNEKNHYIETFDKHLVGIFRQLKISDSLGYLQTKVYKTINIKKEHPCQQNRTNRVKELANFVEAIKPKQTFEIFITNQGFNDLSKICNNYYFKAYNKEIKLYFKKMSIIFDENVRERFKTGCAFLLNVGKFSGAEIKSISKFRDIKNSKADDKSTTTTRTFALETGAKDETFFEHELLPLGWLLCEVVE
jgi:CRISPR-associated protein Csm5